MNIIELVTHHLHSSVWKFLDEFPHFIRQSTYWFKINFLYSACSAYGSLHYWPEIYSTQITANCVSLARTTQWGFAKNHIQMLLPQFCSSEWFEFHLWTTDACLENTQTDRSLISSLKQCIFSKGVSHIGICCLNDKRLPYFVIANAKFISVKTSKNCHIAS